MVLCGAALLGAACSSGTTLKEGDRAPEFSLKAQDGAEVRLSDLVTKGWVVLYFYPKDDTPGCTREACSFRDVDQELRAAGAYVIGVSVDDVSSHRKFHDKHRLNFTILADPDKTVTAQYGVRSAIGLAKRVTFIIDKSGAIRKIYPDVDVAVHAQEVLSLIRTLSHP